MLPYVHAQLLAFCEAERIAPQIIAYDRTDADRLARWAHARVINARQVSVLFVGGRYDPPTPARPADLVPMIESCADMYRDFMVCAFGPREAGCGVLAGLMGGHVRCGFENNLAPELPRDGLSGYGGAIAMGGGRIFMRNSTFRGNRAESSGGAIYGVSTNIVAEQSRFDENGARKSGDRRGPRHTEHGG